MYYETTPYLLLEFTIDKTLLRKSLTLIDKYKVHVPTYVLT